MKLTNCVNFMLNVGFEDVDTYMTISFDIVCII